MFVGFIQRVDTTFYYYTMVDSKITVQEFSGGEDAFIKKLAELKAQLFLGIFEDFLSVDRSILDPGKNTHVYQEKVKRIKDYIKWGHENIQLLPESVAQNGFLATKFMDSIINLISDKNPELKKLIFLKYCVTKTYLDAYTPEQ